MKGIISFDLIKTEFQVDPSTGLLIEPEFLGHNFAHWSKHVPDGPYNIFAAVAYFRPFFFRLHTWIGHPFYVGNKFWPLQMNDRCSNPLF